MLFYVRGIFGIAIFGLLSAGESQLPVTTCKRDLVDYDACLKDALEEAWPRFVKGLPEFDFPPLDPLFYKNGKVVFNSGEMHAVAIFSNLSIIGLSKARFSNVRANFLDDVFHFEMDTMVPIVFTEGIIKINGSINIFRIADEGHVVNDTWIVEHFRINPSLSKFKFDFNSFNEENKELNKIVINFANEFWPVLARVMLPSISILMDPWFTDYANLFFSKVPFSKVFPN
ncbi:PREDICTED: uncharacterized protein LOC105452224 isoform X2 [Wasmannia auropunctata]|uniref:uncharacterized protein LOC105452224 isoform X2 n=1 Tax=Wasmannia auropunctata TaxID=64793 RepID=UPI0005EED188|nr:PREDICTED: uncharacterized protein LOC105452224 isoform X2 [Wasmannia auropunctata]